MVRSTGAIFCDTRPATIIRSACRGEARNTSMPKRERSYRPAPVAIISIAQQASPKVAGHSEPLRAQLASFSTVLTRMPPGSFSRPLPLLMSIPLQSATLPVVHVRDHQQAEEYSHLGQPEDTELPEDDRPGIQEDHLDVEDHEQHRGQVELDRVALAPRQAARLHARLVGRVLRPA